jgi:hypothetical protein
VFFSGGEIDNGSGTVSHIFGTLVMAPAGASGSGTLVKIAFQAVAAGTPQIAISNITLLDSNLNPIVIDDTPDQVTTNVTVTTAEVQTPQIDPSMPLLPAQDAGSARREEGLRKAMGADRPGRTGRFLDNGLGGNLKRFPSEANRNETFFDTPALPLSCSSRQRFDDGQRAGIPFVDG